MMQQVSTMDRQVLLFLIMSVLMHLSLAQNPRQLIRFGKRPFSSDRYRSQLAYMQFPQKEYPRISYPQDGDVQQPLDFQHTSKDNDLPIRKWTTDEDLQGLLEH